MIRLSKPKTHAYYYCMLCLYLVFGRRHRAFRHPIHVGRQVAAGRALDLVLESSGNGGAQRGVEAAAELLLFGGRPIGHVIHAQPKRIVLAVERAHVPVKKGDRMSTYNGLRFSPKV